MNDHRFELPVEMTSESWNECIGANDCAVYGPRGETLAKTRLNALLPTLRSDDNDVRFSCAPASGPAPRVKVTFFTLGEELSHHSPPRETP